MNLITISLMQKSGTSAEHIVSKVLKTSKGIYFSLLLLSLLCTSHLKATDVSGNISSDDTWSLAESPYILAGTVQVNSGVTLTIEPGVEIQSNSTGRNLEIYGTLIAQGTSTNHILITSNNAQGGGSLSIRENALADLEYIDFENLGTSSLSFYDTGLYIYDSDVTADYLTFANCGGQDGTNHIIADANSVSGFGSNNFLEQVTLISNSLDQDAAWPDLDPAGFNYRLAGTQNVLPENSLTIEPGVAIDFIGTGVNLDVFGSLTALGTSSEHISFYSSGANGGGSIGFRDDSVGDLLYGDFTDLGFSSLSFYDAGIYLYETDVTADWLTFQNCGGLDGTRSITADANNVAGFGPNNSVDQVQLISNTLDATTTWPNLDSEGFNYILAGDQRVFDGNNLTIAPGVTIDLPNTGTDLEVLSGGNLIMEGTASEHISFFSSGGNFGGSVALRDGAEGQILYVDFTDLGRSSLSFFDAGLYLDDVNLTADYMTFANCGSNGITSIEANADFVDGIGINNSVDMVLLRGGTFSRTASWPLIDPTTFYYRLEGDVLVAPDHELTISAGNQIQFTNTGADLEIQGELNATGTSTAPIRMYSNNENGGGSLALLESSTSVLNHIEFEDLGRSSLSFYDAGIYMYDCDLTADNLSFTNCGSDNIRSIDALPFSLDQIGANNSLDQIRLRGATMGKNSVWPKVDQGEFSYLISSDITVAEGFELTIEPGVQVNFQATAHDLLVSGTLKAIGTEVDKIRFTSNSAGNGGGSIVFAEPSVSNELSYCLIDSLAKSSLSNWDAAIYTSTGDLTIQKSRIVESQRGIRVQNGQPTITNNIIKDNSIWGLFNNASNADVTACDNYWGDPSGPFNGTNNPDGLGNAISDNVIAADCTADALEIVCPENANVDVGEDYSPEALGSIEVCIQDCETIFSNAFTDSNPDPQCTEDMTRTWTVIDNCGNEKSCSQIIAFTDVIAPTIECAEDLDLGCNAVLPVADFGALVTADNCEVANTSLLSEIETVNGCIHNYTRTYQAEDLEGNSATCSREISIKIDLDDPLLSALPEDITVNCSDFPAAPIITAEDACDGAVSVLFTEDASEDPCNISLVRTWTAVDECGNTATHTQVITGDRGELILSGVPADITIECTELPIFLPSVTASDNCGSVPVTFEQTITGSFCDGSLIRTWTAEDECGNTATETQIITVVKTGCTNPEACNYDSEANIDDSSCLVPIDCEICDGFGGISTDLEVGMICDDGTGMSGQVGIFSAECSCNYFYLGDMNMDNSITVADLSGFLAAFGNPSTNYPLADMNLDGFISVADLSSFLGIYGISYD
ncbi:MAG: hypothetical protein AB8B53_07165 [Flavobacteriales bacterium]